MRLERDGTSNTTGEETTVAGAEWNGQRMGRLPGYWLNLRSHFSAWQADQGRSLAAAEARYNAALFNGCSCESTLGSTTSHFTAAALNLKSMIPRRHRSSPAKQEGLQHRGCVWARVIGPRSKVRDPGDFCGAHLVHSGLTASAVSRASSEVWKRRSGSQGVPSARNRVDTTAKC